MYKVSLEWKSLTNNIFKCNDQLTMEIIIGSARDIIFFILLRNPTKPNFYDLYKLFPIDTTVNEQSVTNATIDITRNLELERETLENCIKYADVYLSSFLDGECYRVDNKTVHYATNIIQEEDLLDIDLISFALKDQIGLCHASLSGFNNEGNVMINLTTLDIVNIKEIGKYIICRKTTEKELESIKDIRSINMYKFLFTLNGFYTESKFFKKIF